MSHQAEISDLEAQHTAALASKQNQVLLLLLHASKLELNLFSGFPAEKAEQLRGPSIWHSEGWL